MNNKTYNLYHFSNAGQEDINTNDIVYNMLSNRDFIAQLKFFYDNNNFVLNDDKIILENDNIYSDIQTYIQENFIMRNFYILNLQIHKQHEIKINTFFPCSFTNSLIPNIKDFEKNQITTIFLNNLRNNWLENNDIDEDFINLLEFIWNTYGKLQHTLDDNEMAEHRFNDKEMEEIASNQTNVLFKDSVSYFRSINTVFNYIKDCITHKNIIKDNNMDNIFVYLGYDFKPLLLFFRVN